ncbi:MAG: PAS domain-containing protein [Nitrospirae bacterium]|nr:PAS domain-containing protein [Nitrospirota bacterium]
MANDRDRTAELEGEIARLKAERDEKSNALRSLKARVADLDKTRRAMLYMLEDLEETTRAVSRAGREWTATVDAISDPLFVHDSDLRLIRANRAYARIAGMDFDDILGRPYYEVFPKMEGPFNSCRKAMEEKEEEEAESLPARPPDRPRPRVRPPLPDDAARRKGPARRGADEGRPAGDRA